MAGLQLPFDRLRPQLIRLGYDVPADSDLLQWRALATQFQSEHRISDSIPGAFDARTTAIVEGVLIALNKIEVRANVEPGVLADPTIFAPNQYNLLLRVPTSAATQIRATINRIIGREVLKILAVDGDYVNLLVIDTPSGKIDESVRGLVELAQIGTSLAAVNGIAVSRVNIGDRDVLVASSGGLSFQVSEETSRKAFRRTGEIIGPLRANPATMRKYVRKEIGGANFVVVLGPALDDLNIEDMVNVPVIRAADLDRPVADIVQRLQQAQNRPLDFDHTVILSGLAKNAAQIAQFPGAETARPGAVDYILAERQRVHRYAKTLGVRVTDKLDKHVGAARDLIVIFAHADGQSFYLPGKKQSRRVGIEQLQKYTKQFARNNPTVLLMACNTGKLDGKADSLAAQLIKMGAGAVIAPRDPIELRAAADFLELLMEQPPGQSLVQRVLQAQAGVDAGGQIRFIVFRRVDRELRSEALTAALGIGGASTE